ncbi:MAG: hypothetical protein ACI33S_04560 [Bacilli bacterium]
MENKKKFAIASLTLSILSLIPLIISPESLTGAQIIVIVGIILGIIGIVLGFIGKSASKGLAIIGIVIGIISCVILCFSLIGFFSIGKATDCVDNKDGTSTCNYLGQELQVPTTMLREDQMKEEEN